MLARTNGDPYQLYTQQIINFHVDSDDIVSSAIKHSMSTGILVDDNYGQPAQVIGAFQPIMRYGLLHQLASAFGLQVGSILSCERGIYSGEMSERLIGLIEALTEWRTNLRKVVDDFNTSMDEEDNQDIFQVPYTEEETESDPITTNELNTKAFIANSLRAYLKGRKHTKSSHVHKIIANLYLVGFMARWHMTVRCHISA